MTPEEWAKEAKERVKYSVNGDQFEQYIAGVIGLAILEARNQALEEAAGVADKERLDSETLYANKLAGPAIRGGWTARRACAEAIASRIRALKVE
jgi:hypothetical protein